MDINAPQKKLRGAEYNACKGRGLGHALLQVFVDEFQVLKIRSDPCLLLQCVRKMRQDLLDSGLVNETYRNLMEKPVTVGYFVGAKNILFQ